MTENLKTAMEIANQITTNLSATYIGSEHLLFGFYMIPEATMFLQMW